MFTLQIFSKKGFVKSYTLYKCLYSLCTTKGLCVFGSLVYILSLRIYFSPNIYFCMLQNTLIFVPGTFFGIFYFSGAQWHLKKSAKKYTPKGLSG